MTLVLIRKDLVLKGSTTKLKDKQVPGICNMGIEIPMGRLYIYRHLSTINTKKKQPNVNPNAPNVLDNSLSLGETWPLSQGECR